jgi:hypothetical protein
MPVDRYELVLRSETEEIERVQVDVDPADGEALRAHLLAAVLRSGGRERDIAAYVLDVFRPGHGEPDFTYVAVERA